MPNIRSLDMKLVDDLFEMGSGYVLDFSDRTMSTFFVEELNVDIDDPIYQVGGTSKAKRLRCFLNAVDLPTAIRTLRTLWVYRETLRLDQKRDEWVSNAEGRFLSLLARLSGEPTKGNTHQRAPTPAVNAPKLLQLKQSLLELSALASHARGYAFEAWLKNMFDLFGLAPREPFRLLGEQIDGSFVMDGETYLLEAKWQSTPVGVAELHAFHGKLEQKAAWARGLFVSNSGFTAEGLVAFGHGKRAVCMDGLDLFDMLNREIPFTSVLARKVRRAAETGQPFARVRDLFGG